MGTEPRDKLPVPGPWQRGVRAAMADLAQRAGVPPHAVAVTRVEAASGGLLDVWLMVGGRTRRYQVRPDGTGLVMEADRA
jgi:hypothetical protein